MWKIQRMGDPTPTLGDDLPFYSCYYEKVPDEYRLRNLIKPDTNYPYTEKILYRLIMVADLEFKKWEIKGESFADFGDLVRLHYYKNKASLEDYIHTRTDLIIALSNITKNTIGAGKVELTGNVRDTKFTSNIHTLDTLDQFTGSDDIDTTVSMVSNNESTTKNKTTGETTDGSVALNPQKTDPDFSPDHMGKTKGSNDTEVRNENVAENSNFTGSFHDNNTTHTGDIKDRGRIKDYLVTKNTTKTDERVTETETITPGVAIAELAKIPGIMSVEQYFINILKPCFTLYRWYHW